MADVERIELTSRMLAEDCLVFGLRMNEGVNLPALGARFPAAPWEKVAGLAARLEEAGLAEWADDRLRLTLCGRLVADAVAVQIMEAMAEPVPAETNRFE
jgi:oxygen-independent coproporphyrinogen-3 oxidase